MLDYERTRASQWLREMRGDISQDRLAADITRTTGWSITRDRYSKYESGSLPFGRSVLQHFIDYWATKGRPGPDFTPPPPEVSLEERAVLAAEAQASAIAALVAELREWRTADRDRIAGLENLVGGLAERLQLAQGSAAQPAPPALGR